MRLPNYTYAAIRCAKLAGRLAARAGAKKVEPEHLLLALLARGGILSAVLVELALDPVGVRRRAKELAQVAECARRSTPRLSTRMEKILLMAEDEAGSLGSIAIKPEHLLLAVIRENGPAGRLLDELGATYAIVRRTLRKLRYLPMPARCPKCGYDLRATPERCPECGEVI